MFGLKDDWSLDSGSRYFTMDHYEGAEGRWCPGCGDFAVLTCVQRICRDEQLEPEKVVCVSGIGCSSRFPHYMGTYGFHGLHGRALPVACGVKARRPDLDIFVATGDGDCCSIGAGHWMHAVRYNMDMTVMLFDNNIYGLTKKQTSPTSACGLKTNTHPRGSWLPPLDPLQTTLGFTNLSFLAQTVDWNIPHLYATLLAAHRHPGLGFVRILQRCPTYTDDVFAAPQEDPSLVLMLEHDDAFKTPASLQRVFPNRQQHDPSDIAAARQIADRRDVYPIGLLYQDRDAPRYDEYCTQGMDMGVDEKLKGLELELDRFAV